MKKLALALILLLPLFGFTKCKQDQAQEPSPTTSTSENNAESETTEEDTDKSDLLSGFGTDQDYRVTIKGSGAGAENMGEITVEFDAPDKTRTIIKAPQGSQEIIVTPEAGYMKMGGSWMKTPGADVESMVQVNHSSEDLQKMINAKGIKYLGKEPCGDTTCKVYGGTFEGNNAKVYFDPKKGRPHRVEASTPDGMNSTIDYEYTEITIEIPEVDGMDLSNIGSMGGKASPEDIQKMMEQFKDL